MNAEPAGILIVDDEPDTCANLADILSDLGYRVAVAHNGRAALELMAQEKFEIAIIDLRMPGMDGLELYRRIREVSAGTAAFIVTAYAGGDSTVRALAAGARRVLSKPVNVTQLLSLVEETLDSPLLLVVDDDTELCDNLWEIFQERGYRVHLVHDAATAGEELAQRKFHVVLLDLKLPGGDGCEVLKLVNDLNPSARTVLVTGFPGEMELRIRMALQEGAKGVAFKPFDVDALLKTVGSLVSDAASRGNK